MSGNETEINFALIGKNDRKDLQDVKAVFRVLQHWLTVAEHKQKKIY